MNRFEYTRVHTVRQASDLAAEDPEGTLFLAGGLDLLAEMKEGTRQPRRLVNLKGIADLRAIAVEGTELRVGALATLADLEGHALVRERCAALAEAAGTIASPQVRNVATVGGNLLQRPRCPYYRGVPFHCLRKGGAECFAMAGDSRHAGILGIGPAATAHPSDLAPLLVALDARVWLEGKKRRSVRLAEFYLTPNRGAPRDNVLEPGEVLTAVAVPALPEGWRAAYVREAGRGALGPTLASAAALLHLRDGVCREARVVLGGVAPVPWRAGGVEKLLRERRIDPDSAKQAAEAATEGATPLPGNDYKVALTRAVVRRAILRAAGLGIE